MILHNRAVVACDASMWPGVGPCDATLLPADTDFAIQSTMEGNGWTSSGSRDVCPRHKHLVAP